jgi:SAM-dependent methyltransferase
MPMVKKLLYLALTLATLACRTDLLLGKVEGVAATIYAPNGRTPAYRAKVAVADAKPGGYYGEAFTSANGYFVLTAIPDGLYRADVRSPNGLLKSNFHAEVIDGYTSGGVEALLAPARVGTFVNVPGRYDDSGTIFADLGYQYKTIGVESLAQNINPLRDADIVCLNSGVDTAWAQDERVIESLRSFVEKGGRLIASDQAWPFVKAAWPGKITWGTDPAIGEAYQDITAAFADADLKKYAAVPEWRLRYDLGNWAVPAGTAGTVFVRGDVETAFGKREDAPLLVGFAYGDGYVAFATFDWRTQYRGGRLSVRVFNYLITNK